MLLPSDGSNTDGELDAQFTCCTCILGTADDPKLALLCIKFSIANFTFMVFSFKKEKIHHAQCGHLSSEKGRERADFSSWVCMCQEVKCVTRQGIPNTLNHCVQPSAQQLSAESTCQRLPCVIRLLQSSGLLLRRYLCQKELPNVPFQSGPSGIRAPSSGAESVRVQQLIKAQVSKYLCLFASSSNISYLPSHALRRCLGGVGAPC
ncbi:hypothetical protein EK904_009909 [Melospiza melodia maxima]|nr:hypothetical protein EK904_009909 [Melospiza melodia maxima]